MRLKQLSRHRCVSNAICGRVSQLRFKKQMAESKPWSCSTSATNLILQLRNGSLKVHYDRYFSKTSERVPLSNRAVQLAGSNYHRFSPSQVVISCSSGVGTCSGRFRFTNRLVNDNVCCQTPKLSAATSVVGFFFTSGSPDRNDEQRVNTSCGYSHLSHSHLI